MGTGRAGWLTACACVCGGQVWAADPGSATRWSDFGVDMAIEWVPYVRPSVQPLAAGASTEAAPATLGQHQAWALRTEDRRLSMALQRWCVLAGWQLVWEAERDFPIEAGIEFEGHLSGALEQVMKSLEDSDYPLQAVMNPQTRVLRVRRQMEVAR